MTLPGNSDEFSIIGRYFAPLAAGVPGAAGLRDDAATFSLASGRDGVVTADGMVEDVHFRRSDGPDLIARKLLRVNLSDLASEGAQPLGYLLVAAWPRDISEEWIAAFAKGLAQDQEAFGIKLLGGDTVSTSGPMSFSLTAIGHVGEGRALRRSGAAVGDIICVTGTVGDAALSLKLSDSDWAAEAKPSAADVDALRQRLVLPEPRLAVGQRLVGIASSCVDVSDGLAQDVGHIASASAIGCTLRAGSLPLSDAAARLVAQAPALLALALAGGDDYELAFTVPPDKRHALPGITAETGARITEIGVMEPEPGVRIVDGNGVPVRVKSPGYRHF